MDPNATLAELRTLAAIDAEDTDDADQHLARMQELIAGLDEWLSGGDYPPTAWQQRPRPDPVVELVAQLRQAGIDATDPEADWPGADVVPVLARWLHEQGVS
jgi:hypothetical protein